MANTSIQELGDNNTADNASKSGNTTYVQADPTCFRDLVQRLTCPSQPTPPPKPAKKLHERRKYDAKPKIEIAKPQFQPANAMQSVSGYGPNATWTSYPSSPSAVVMMSPPSSLPPSPISTHKRSSQAPVELNRGEEEKAIREKRFYLHPSPRSKQRISYGPELLTLFPPVSPNIGDGDTKDA